MKEEDPAFAGGITGLPWMEKTIIPSRWLEMSEDELGASLTANRSTSNSQQTPRCCGRNIVELVWLLFS